MPTATVITSTPATDAHTQPAMLLVRQQNGSTRLFSAAAYRQPTEPQRDAQREAALERQRATAAEAQRGDPAAAAAFPMKDPAKQRPLLAGQRMVDIRVSTASPASRVATVQKQAPHPLFPCASVELPLCHSLVLAQNVHMLFEPHET